MASDLYALCDRSLLDRYNLNIEDFVKAAKRFDASIIQYRDKTSTLDEKQENLLKLRSLWDGTLIVNDEIGLVQFCDGVHVGQEDLFVLCEHFGAKSKIEAIGFLRKIIGKKIIGVSTHTKEEIEEANLMNIDYIGLGAYRSTSTKDVSYILGDRLLELAKLSKHPVVAIGGVRLFDHLPGIWLKAVGSDLCIKAKSFA